MTKSISNEARSEPAQYRLISYKFLLKIDMHRCLIFKTGSDMAMAVAAL